MNAAAPPGGKWLALCGGVGGAKLALGLAQVLSADALAIIGNTGDDFIHLGLHIAPDLDTIMYNLAGRADTARGWGLSRESWRAFESLKALGGPDWFQLGDQDLATHLYRTQLLAEGRTLSAATQALCAGLGVKHPIWPMSDDRVATMVDTDQGVMPFQHYFVRAQCQPAVRGFMFDGIADARPNSALMQRLADPDLAAVVICPSNPMVSIDPILKLPGVAAALRATAKPVIAVSPLIGGQAVKGPTAKMLTELGLPVSSLGIAQHYHGLIDGLVIDPTDRDDAKAIAKSGIKVFSTPSLMRNLADKIRLARDVVKFAAMLGGGAGRR
ncbi:MAG: 2-phospho-L-lactate transferase [Sphingomonadales bacterium]